MRTRGGAGQGGVPVRAAGSEEVFATCGVLSPRPSTREGDRNAREAAHPVGMPDQAELAHPGGSIPDRD